MSKQCEGSDRWQRRGRWLRLVGLNVKKHRRDFWGGGIRGEEHKDRGRQTVK